MAQRGKAVDSGWMGKRLLLVGSLTVVEPDGYLPELNVKQTCRDMRMGATWRWELAVICPKKEVESWAG